MRYSAICTDSLAFTRALRVEAGFAPAIQEGTAVALLAMAEPDAATMLKLAGIAHRSASTIVLLRGGRPFQLHKPADVVVIAADGDRVNITTGKTLWAGLQPSGPLLLVDRSDAQEVHAMTNDGLVGRSGLPLGVEASAEPGFVRAMQRIADRLPTFGGSKDAMPLAA
jgi:hypothetical protein